MNPEVSVPDAISKLIKKLQILGKKKKYVKREHRYNFRKDKLVNMGYDPLKSETQIMFELGYDKIWDTGNLKYIMVC